METPGQSGERPRRYVNGFRVTAEAYQSQIEAARVLIGAKLAQALLPTEVQVAFITHERFRPRWLRERFRPGRQHARRTERMLTTLCLQDGGRVVLAHAADAKPDSVRTFFLAGEGALMEFAEPIVNHTGYDEDAVEFFEGVRAELGKWVRTETIVPPQSPDD